MKKLIFCLLTALFAALMLASCHVYERIEVEEIRCPEIRDTITVPGWDKQTYEESIKNPNPY